MRDGIPTEIITYACGHAREYDIFDSRLRRAGGAEGLSESVCPTCVHADENAKAITQGRADGLPELQGTERQVAWAASIRQQGIADINAQYERLASALAHRWETLGDIDEIYIAECLQAAQDAKGRFASETSAAWWIDHQGGMGERCLRSATALVPTLRAANNARLGLPHPDEIRRAEAEAQAAAQAAREAAWDVESRENKRVMDAYHAVHEPYFVALHPLVGNGWDVQTIGAGGGDAPRDVVAHHRKHRITYTAATDRLRYDVPEQYRKHRAAVKAVFQRISRENEFGSLFVGE